MGRLKHSLQDCPSNQLLSLTYVSYDYEIYQQWPGLSELMQIKLYLSIPFTEANIKCIYLHLLCARGFMWVVINSQK